jgi:hypothetical protein
MNGMAAVEWSDLRVFLAVAREGTLGGAARRLGQSQPTMGRRLRELDSHSAKSSSSATMTGSS